MQTHLEKKNFFLSQLRYFVIDESDTLIDAGFKDYLQNFIKIIQNKQK